MARCGDCGANLRSDDSLRRHRKRCWGIPRRERVLARPICGAWMPRDQEHCARLPGHADSHRSRYALDNAARSRREGWAA